jgi:hypothetical protein
MSPSLQGANHIGRQVDLKPQLALRPDKEDRNVSNRPTRQAVFRSVLRRHTPLEDQNHSGVFFIGLGDQFDDDRRLVREAASAPRARTWIAPSHYDAALTYGSATAFQNRISNAWSKFPSMKPRGGGGHRRCDFYPGGRLEMLNEINPSSRDACVTDLRGDHRAKHAAAARPAPRPEKTPMKCRFEGKPAPAP